MCDLQTGLLFDVVSQGLWNKELVKRLRQIHNRSIEFGESMHRLRKNILTHTAELRNIDIQIKSVDLRLQTKRKKINLMV